jgi:hypothetical protein
MTARIIGIERDTAAGMLFREITPFSQWQLAARSPPKSTR